MTLYFLSRQTESLFENCWLNVAYHAKASIPSRSRISFPCLPVARRKSLRNRFVSCLVAGMTMYRRTRVLDNPLSVSLGGKRLSSCVLYRLAAQEAAQRDPGYASQYRRRPRLAGLSGLGDWTSFGGEVRAKIWENRSRKIFVDGIVLVGHRFPRSRPYRSRSFPSPRGKIAFSRDILPSSQRREIQFFREKRSVLWCTCNLLGCLWKTAAKQPKVETETCQREDIAERLWCR